MSGDDTVFAVLAYLFFYALGFLALGWGLHTLFERPYSEKPPRQPGYLRRQVRAYLEWRKWSDLR